jgi:type IV secretion system protein VirD4
MSAYEDVPFLRFADEVLHWLVGLWGLLPAHWSVELKALAFLAGYVAAIVLLGWVLRLLRKLLRAPGYLLSLWWLRLRSPFGRSRWASFKALKRVGLFREQGLFLGQWRGWLRKRDLFHHGEGHFMTIAGTGGGKTTGLVVPSILECREGSLIITDPSGELAAMTRRFREGVGPVVVLNPFFRDFAQETGLTFPDTGFNPLSVLERGPNLKDDIDVLARLLMVTDRVDSGSYWNREGAEIITALVMWMFLREPPRYRNLVFLYELLRGDKTRLVFERMAGDSHRFLRAAGGKFLNLIDHAPGQWQGALSKAQDATKRYTPQTPLGVHTTKNGFNPDRLKKENVTVFLMVPSGRIRVAEPWLNLLMGVFGMAVGKPGPARPVTLLVDEAPALGYMPDLHDFMRQFRKAGLRVWLFSQTAAALREIYGKDGFAELMGLCATKQFFAIEELDLAHELSGYLGERTAYNPSQNEQREGMSTVGIPLLRPEEITAMKAGEQIIVRGKLYPIKARLVPYFTRPQWRALVDPNPYLS